MKNLRGVGEGAQPELSERQIKTERERLQRGRESLAPGNVLIFS